MMILIRNLDAQNLDTDALIDTIDTPSRFFLPGPGASAGGCEVALAELCKAWELYGARENQADTEWAVNLSSHLNRLVDMRIEHVEAWISSNLSRFKASHANVEDLRRALEIAIVDLKANVELCKIKCSSCHLSCLLSRRHDPLDSHNCQTSHLCRHVCEFEDEHPDGNEKCGCRYVSFPRFGKNAVLKLWVQCWPSWSAYVSYI